ncbi:MAG: hypothetical protein JWM57_1119 [Phycisphaerales bacterium]|nr:hypothetical protein [Phycisphaerales bacterium]
MATDLRKQLLPGTRVRITQQIAARNYSLASTIEGTVVSYGQRTTGSWYAHSRDDKLWLDRVELRKVDGEVTILNLDDYSQVEILGPAVVSPAVVPPAAS